MNKDLNLDLEKEIEELTIPCKYKNDNWLCTIKRYRAYKGYMELIIVHKEKEIKLLCGGSEKRWIEFPDLKLKSELSNLNDTLNNAERLLKLLGNPEEAISVTYTLNRCQNTLPFLW